MGHLERLKIKEEKENLIIIKNMVELEKEHLETIKNSFEKELPVLYEQEIL